MKATATLIFALIMVASSFTSPQAAALRNNVTVVSEVVRLGDLFADAGDQADTVVAAAPAPGQKQIFSTHRLWALARDNKLKWTPTSRYDRVTIVRAGRPIDHGEIAERLRTALMQAGLPENHEIAINNRNLNLFAPIGAQQPFTLHNTRLNARTGGFSTMIVVPTGKHSVTRMQVTGIAYAMVEVPVLNRRIKRGEIIERGDLSQVRLRRNILSRNAILESDVIVGKASRRTLRPGVPLKNSDLRRPIVITKGSLVNIVIRTKNMILTAKGRAIQNGAMGDAVRVKNTRSKTIIDAIVVAPNRVFITIDETLPAPARPVNTRQTRLVQ